MRKVLTPLTIEKMKPPARGQTEIFDRGYPGLSLRISYAGTRSWYIFYRHGGKVRRLRLGLYPVMDLTGARQAWREAREKLERGADPRTAPPSLEFETVFLEWLRKDQEAKGNRSADSIRRRITHHVLPYWRGRSIVDIGRRDIHDALDKPLEAGNVSTAIRVHAHLNRLFRWAVNRGIIEAHKNPMAEMEKPGADIRRERVLTDDELRQVLSVASTLGFPFGHAIKLLVFTGARREEIWQLKWSEVRGNEIHLDSSRTKTGAANIIPLSPAARAVLNSIAADGPFVFGRNKTPSDSWGRTKRKIDGMMSIEPWRVHDIRRTVATGLQRLGVALQVTEAVLGHTSGSRAGIIGVYQRHTFANEKRQALEAWADHVAGLTP